MEHCSYRHSSFYDLIPLWMSSIRVTPFKHSPKSSLFFNPINIYFDIFYTHSIYKATKTIPRTFAPSTTNLSSFCHKCYTVNGGTNTVGETKEACEKDNKVWVNSCLHCRTLPCPFNFLNVECGKYFKAKENEHRVYGKQ